MDSNKLAILGGSPILKEKLMPRTSFGKEEISAAEKVVKSGLLSDFVAQAGDKFLGGKYVKELEGRWQEKFKVKHAVSFSSATTALQAAIAALGIGPGDEVIVPPITMSATVAAILWNNAIPVFADIEEETLCIDPKSIRERITDRTKAILVVDLYGQGADLKEIMKIAESHNLKVIEDNAQSPGAKIENKYVGTIGDIGVFSLNFHKVIHCGEGGILVTNDDNLRFRAQLIRNHGEVVLDDLGDWNTVLLGSNYRLTELQAAVAIEQIKKLDFLNEYRIKLANYLTPKLKSFEGLIPVQTRKNSTNVYYQYPIRFREEVVGIKRRTFIEAMEKEGFSLGGERVKPLYLLPIYQRQTVYKTGVKCPFDCPYYGRKIHYKKGLCPTAERMHEKELLLSSICAWPLTLRDIDLFLKAIKKIFNNIEELKTYEKEQL